MHRLATSPQVHHLPHGHIPRYKIDHRWLPATPLASRRQAHALIEAAATDLGVDACFLRVPRRPPPNS